MKDKKKKTAIASRMMKLTLTDGLNQLEAIEYEKVNHIDSFEVN
jgi:hypothetical protein